MSYNIRTTLDVQDNLNIGLNANISGSLSVTGSIYGNLNGTATSASYVLNAVSSSRAVSASFALNGGVTQLLAGPNVTLSPTNGLGQVTVSATLSGSTSFNTATGSYGSFYDTTIQTNPVANIPRSMSFDSTDITNGVSISGSTSPFNTYIKTQNAGIYNIQFSAQVEKTDSGTDEIVIWLRKNGIDLTDSATKLTLSGNSTKVVAAWNWFVSSAANDYYQIIWVSADTGMRLYAEPINSTPGIPSVIVTANRVDQFLSNTGSFSGSFTGQFTGSLFGTSSWAQNALTASFAPNYLLLSNTGSMLAPYVLNSSTSSFTTTSSFNSFTSSINNFTSSINNITRSFATTGSNIFVGSQTITGSLFVMSGSNNILHASSSGNVGIGTSTPAVKLDVFGTGQIINMGNGTSTDAYIDFAGNRGKFGFEAATGIRFQGTNTRPIIFALGNWGTGEIARFSTQGFFGLNTNAPSAWLHISGTVASSSLFKIDAPGSASIFEVSGSGVVTINGAIPVTRNATGYNVGRFTNSASFDNIRVAISSSGNPVASSVSGSVNVFYSAISSVAGSAISSSVNTGAIFTTGSWSVLTSATLGSGGDTITSHIQDQDRGRLYRATFIQTAGPASGSVVIERLI